MGSFPLCDFASRISETFGRMKILSQEADQEYSLSLMIHVPRMLELT